MKKIIRPKKTKGSMNIRTEIVDRVTKKPLFKKEEVETINTKVGRSVMIVRDVAQLKLTYGYNSVGVEVGVEMPMSCEPGDLAQAHKNMDRVEAMVQKRMESKAAEMKKILLEVTRRDKMRP